MKLFWFCVGFVLGEGAFNLAMHAVYLGIIAALLFWRSPLVA